MARENYITRTITTNVLEAKCFNKDNNEVTTTTIKLPQEVDTLEKAKKYIGKVSVKHDIFDDNGNLIVILDYLSIELVEELAVMLEADFLRFADIYPNREAFNNRNKDNQE